MNVRVLVSLALPLLLLPVSRGAGSTHSLFKDPVVAKAKTFEIHESDVEEAVVAFKAAAAALGRPAPEAADDALKKQLLDKIVATKLLIGRATPSDRDDAKKLGDKLIAKTRADAGSDASYKRKLYAVGSSPEKYEAEIREQALVQVVIDRELKSKAILSDADIKKYYDEHPEMFTEPERAKVQHILFAIRKIPSGELLPLDQRLMKKTAAERALARARKGEDFSKLVQELSEDKESKSRNGEIVFAKGSGIVPPEFEAAALSLQPGGVSDLVTTVFGYDIIKLLDKIPPSVVPLDKVHDDIGERLQRMAVQKKLPDFVTQLRKEANVQILATPE